MTAEDQNLRSRQVDAAIAEYLEAAEHGALPEREAFLARHADIAADLNEFLTNQRALDQAHPRPAVDAPTVDHAISTDVVLADTPRPQIIRAGVSSQLEVQTVLRKRLRFLAILFCTAFSLGSVAALLIFGTALAFFLWIPLVAIACFATIIWLCSRPLVSLRLLRWIEAGFFGLLTLFFAWHDVAFVNSGWFARLASYHTEGMIIATRYSSGSWAVFIIVYGVLIPNTARRCLVAVMLLVLLRMAILAAVVLPLPDVPAGDKGMFFGHTAFGMIFVGAVAIFGAHRIESMRRTAAEARQLGPYQLTRRLGSGGMGEVYLAQHALLRRPCALKLIRPDQVGDRSTLARFEREVQTMAALTHPNTVRVYDYGLSADGTFYYAMEYLPGLSLHELVTAHGPLSPARAVHLLRQVCGALREAHAVGLVHRDIKPANILACKIGGVDDVAKLLDFGLVRDNGVDDNGAHLTRAGTIAGTPAFMSPEQAAGAEHVDARSDIYSLGTVAYFLLSGRPPFERSTSVEIMAAHLTQPVVALRHLRSDIPVDVEEVVSRCLEKEPSRRFPDIVAVEATLARCACADDWSSNQAAGWWQVNNELVFAPAACESLSGKA